MADVVAEIQEMVRIRHKNATYRRVISQLTGMRGAALRVAQLLTESPNAVFHMGIAEIAEQCETSPASLLRISREVGYRNFSELRAAILAGDDEAVNPFALERTSLFLTSLMDTFDTLNMELIVEAANRICQARVVVVFGALLSSTVAYMVDLCLRRLRVVTLYSSDSELIVNSLNSPDQLLFCVSHMGFSPPVIRVLSHAKRQNVPVVLLTNLANAPGCRYADLLLTTNVTSVPNTGEDVFPRVSSMLIVDLLLQEVARIKAAGENARQEV